MGEPRDDAMMEGRSMLRASRMLGWLVGWLSRGVACVAVARCATLSGERRGLRFEGER